MMEKVDRGELIKAEKKYQEGAAVVHRLVVVVGRFLPGERHFEDLQNFLPQSP